MSARLDLDRDRRQMKNMNDVILIDAGTGNLRSVQKALESVGANVTRTDDPQKVLSGKAGCVARRGSIW